MVYAIANPVSSHLVDKVHHWPGVESLAAIEEDVPLVASKPGYQRLASVRRNISAALRLLTVIPPAMISSRRRALPNTEPICSCA